MGVIVFALTARSKLEQRLARQLAADPTSLNVAILEVTVKDLQEKLGKVFPTGRVVIVRDVYGGFRTRPKEHVLLVEVADSGDQDGLSVVKLGPTERLMKELAGWESCRPHGLRHDIIMMDLHPRKDAVRDGEPTPQSVAEVIFQIYERIGLLFYRHSYDENPGDESYQFDPNRLDSHLLVN